MRRRPGWRVPGRDRAGADGPAGTHPRRPRGRASSDRRGVLAFPATRGARSRAPSTCPIGRGREPHPGPPFEGAARARGDPEMTVDVVCAGPPFLDLVFRGLPRLPEAGEEVLANEVAIVPGAMANVAFSMRHPGVDAVVC